MNRFVNICQVNSSLFHFRVKRRLDWSLGHFTATKRPLNRGEWVRCISGVLIVHTWALIVALLLWMRAWHLLNGLEKEVGKSVKASRGSLFIMSDTPNCHRHVLICLIPSSWHPFHYVGQFNRFPGRIKLDALNAPPPPCHLTCILQTKNITVLKEQLATANFVVWLGSPFSIQFENSCISTTCK